MSFRIQASHSPQKNPFVPSCFCFGCVFVSHSFCPTAVTKKNDQNFDESDMLGKPEMFSIDLRRRHTRRFCVSFFWGELREDG